MREITKLMINKYKINELCCDFMGYSFKKESELSFHHLIVPKRLCKVKNISEGGYVEWNGAILRQCTSHNYLHLIERYDRDIFLKITGEMIDENLRGSLDIDNLKRIDELLCQFEKEYSGLSLIKDEYTKRLIKRKTYFDMGKE